MQEVHIATTTTEQRDNAKGIIGDRSLLYDKDTEDLFIKYSSSLYEIGGKTAADKITALETTKQDNLTTGDNIELTDNTIQTTLEPVFNTINLSGENTTSTSHTKGTMTPSWKGGKFLGKLTNSQYLLLMKKTNISDTIKGLIGGEVLIKINNGSIYDHHNISLSSTGSRSYVGSTDIKTKTQLFQAVYNNETYYGIKVPEIYTMVLNQYTTDIQFYLLRNTSMNSFGLQVKYKNKDADDWTSKIFALTQGEQVGTSYNYWYYVELGAIRSFLELGMKQLPQNDNFTNYFKTGYYMLFKIYRKSSGTDMSVRITDYNIKSVTTGTKGDVVLADPLTSFGFTNNTSLFTTSTYASLALSSNISMSTYYTTFTLEEQTTTSEIPSSVEFSFNGWINIPSSISPPASYADSDLSSIVPLADEAETGTTDVKINGDSASTSADDISNTVDTLPTTGEDGTPNTIKMTGTITLDILNALAAKCKDPDKQIVIDLREATVDSTAEDWSTDIFKSCTSLRAFYFPKGVKSVTGFVFSWCTYLRYLDMSASDTTLVTFGSNTWTGTAGMFTSTRIRYLRIPPNCTTVGGYIFSASNIEWLNFTTTTLPGTQWNTFSGLSSDTSYLLDSMAFYYKEANTSTIQASSSYSTWLSNCKGGGYSYKDDDVSTQPWYESIKDYISY